MACPKCGCRVHYEYDDGDDLGGESEYERCAACGHVFHGDDALDEEDDEIEGGAAAMGENRGE